MICKRRIPRLALALILLVAGGASREPQSAKDQANPRLAALGQALFNDRALALNGTVAGADCHKPGHGFAESRPSVPGTGRNTPTLLGVTRRGIWGWDGRHKRLEDALTAPMLDPHEMGNQSLAQIVARVGPRYAAFSDDGSVLTPQSLVAALAAYLRQVDRPGRFDRYMAGEIAVLSDQERQGLHLFRSKARCVTCHSGPQFTDDRFHNLRLSAFGEASQDLGRWRVTRDALDVGRFRTPTLRGISRTAPYMHSGHFTSLQGVVRFYMRGGGEVRARDAAEAARPLFAEAATLSPLIRPFELTEDEIAALVAFLRAL